VFFLLLRSLELKRPVWLSRKLARVSSHFRSDVAESLVDVRGDRIHTYGGCEGDQGNNEGIFDQILTVVTQQDLYLYRQS
jgi:hypothetical protein